MVSSIVVEMRKLNAPKHAPPYPKYPAPNGPGIRFEGTAETPSSAMCSGMADEDQIKCLCPSPLDYALNPLPAPKDSNYSTEIVIKKVDRPMYRVRIFSRAQIDSTGPLVEYPPVNSHSGLSFGKFDYDPFTLVMNSSAPEDEFKLDVHTSEGLRLKCINQDN